MAKKNETRMNDVKQMNYNALMVLQCLFENSDQYRHLSLKKIEELIRNKYGFGPTHNTINKILHYLPDYGFDVKNGSRSNPGFYLNSRYFSNGEILYVIESIRKTRSMSDEDKQGMINKFKTYLGPEFSDLDTETAVSVKGKGEQIINNIEQINDAIKKGSILHFSYYSDPKLKEEIRVESSPYKLFERKGELYLLYGCERFGEFYLLQIKVSAMFKLLVDHVYKSTPMFKARNYQYIEDRLLSKVDTENPARRYNYHLLVEMPDKEQVKKNEFWLIKGKPISTEQCKKTLESHFGKNNIMFIEADGKSYAMIRDIYGDGSNFMFLNYQLGKIVWPKEETKLAQVKIAKLYNLYNQDKEPLEDNIFISIADAEGEQIGNEEDWFGDLKARYGETQITEDILAELEKNTEKREFDAVREFDAQTYIRNLYFNTDEETKFVFEEYYDRNWEEGEDIKSAEWYIKFKWSEKDCNRAIKDFDKLYTSIQNIAKTEKTEDLLPADLKVWKNYIRGWQTDDHASEALERTSGENATASLFLIGHARRLYELLKNNGPAILVQNELKMMTIAFVVNRYAEEFREIIE